jgi:polyisoprenoid-binding protein YceI
MKKILLGLLVLSMSVFAQDFDQKKSSLKWTGTKVTGKHFGSLKFKSADVSLSKGSLKSAKLIVDMNSIDVTDLTGKWKGKFLAHVKSGDFFEVKKHPTSTLMIEKVDAKKLHGQLTIKGITQPISIPYTLKGKTYTGKMTFNRTKFNMKYKSGNFFKDLGDKVIHDDVTVDFVMVIKEKEMKKEMKKAAK